MEDRLLTPEEVAQRLSVSPKSIRKWLKANMLKGRKMGRLWRIKENDLQAFLDAAQPHPVVSDGRDTSEARRQAAVQAAYGCLAGLPGSVDEFLSRKHQETEEEERRWEERHRQ